MSTPNKEPFIRPETFWNELGLRANQSLAHFGCGAGFYIIPGARIVGKKGKAYGIDVLPDMLAETENKARRENVSDIVQTIRANIENGEGSTLEKDSLDWVLVANILYQSDVTKIIAEAARVIKKGGSIVVLEWDIIATPLGPPNEKRVSKQEVLEVAQKLDLKLINEFKPSPYHYGLIFTVKN